MIALPRYSTVLRYDSTFVTTTVGTVLIAKAAGFIAKERAELLQVSETTIEMRIGHSWLGRLLKAEPSHPPVHVRLAFHEPGAETTRRSLPKAPSKEVRATIAPIGAWQAEEFERIARGIMWRLQAHFLAYSGDHRGHARSVVDPIAGTLPPRNEEPTATEPDLH